MSRDKAIADMLATARAHETWAISPEAHGDEAATATVFAAQIRQWVDLLSAPAGPLGEAGARLRAIVAAAEQADWQQVVLNGGPPCFHYEGNRGHFCLRAERWAGHDADHPFISLARLFDALLSAPVVSGWQPIETAPKMRTILLWAATDIGEDGTVRNWKMATGAWHTGYDDARSLAKGWTPWTWDGRQLKAYDAQPTHWLPLPAAPVVTQEGE